MELKVWVEGIQRIICGVSEQTTCQDVVVALAHATGKTGRFVLVERWRDNEKLMSPAESPARALSKWGEYAAEVQFILRKSDSQSRPPSVQHGYLSAMPDFYGDSGGGGGGGRGVRKMATFSGAHGNVGGDALTGGDAGGGPRGEVARGRSLDVPDGGAYDLLRAGGVGGHGVGGHGLDVVQGGVGAREQAFRRSLPKDVMKKWPHEAPTRGGGGYRPDLPWVRTPAHQTNVSSDTESMSASSPRSRRLAFLQGSRSLDTGATLLPAEEESETQDEVAVAAVLPSNPRPSNQRRRVRHHPRYNANYDDDYTRAMSDSEGYNHSTCRGGGGGGDESHALSDGEGYGGGRGRRERQHDSDGEGYGRGRGRRERQHDSGNESDSVLVSYNQVRHHGPKRTDSFKAALNIISEDSPGPAPPPQPPPPPLADDDDDRYADGRVGPGQPPAEVAPPSRESEFREKVVDRAGVRYDEVLQLVHLQQERLTDQTSQLNNYDTELNYWDGREQELQDQLSAVLVCVRNEAATCDTQENELDSHAGRCWEDEVVMLRQEESKAVADVALMQAKIEHLDNELTQYREKLRVLGEEYRKESRDMEEVKEKKKRQELKELQEIAHMQSEISDKVLSHEETVKEIEGAQELLAALEEQLQQRRRQADDLLQVLRDENMQAFDKPESPELGVITEGEPAPTNAKGTARKMTFAPQTLANVMPTPQNPHGMWV